MKKNIILYHKVLCLLLLAALCGHSAGAEGLPETSVESILSEIESNNLSLKALRNKADAEAQESLSEAALPDPEVEFAYLFGAGENNPRRRDFSISQSFDFASLSGSRRAAAQKGASLAELEYRAARKDILTQARKLIIEIVSLNALVQEFEVRLRHASAVEKAYALGLEKGEFNIIDYRKAALNLTSTESELQRLFSERETLLLNLKALNGGSPVEVNDTEQSIPLLPEDFEQWLSEAAEENSSLKYMNENTALEEEKLRLTKNETLPAFSVGYMAELIPGEEFRGVKVGFSLPLWSSSRKLQGAKGSLSAARLSESAERTRFRANAEALFAKAKSLGETADKYKALSSTEQVCSDLDKALEVGSISLLEYMTELSFYYEAKQKALELERDYAATVAELLSLAM